MPTQFTNYSDTIFHHAAQRPKAIALEDAYSSLSWKKLADLVGRASVWLKSLGIEAGEPVGVLMTNSVDHIILSLALARIGAARAEFGITQATRVFDSMIETLKIKTLFIEPPGRSLGAIRCISIGLDWRDSLAAFKGDARHADDFEPFDLAMSSGSTGKPKGVPTSHAVTLRRMQDFRPSMTELGVFSDDGTGSLLLTSSLAYAGFLYFTIYRLGIGGKVVVVPEYVKLMDLVRAIHAQKDAVLILTSSRCEDLIACAPDEGLLFPNAKAMVSLGAPLAGRAKRDMLNRVSPNFMEFYGSSGVGLISVLRPEDILDHADSVGRLFSGVEVEIVDSNDVPVEPGVVGHLRGRGAGMAPEVISEQPAGRFEGYRDGWYYPGDLAAIDADGYVYVKGRVSDIVRRGGVDVLPTVVELALMSHESVQEAAVVGVPGSRDTEIVAVIMAKGKEDAAALHQHCVSTIGDDHTPNSFVFVSRFPRAAGDKIDRAKVRQHAEQALAKARETPRIVI